MPIKQLACTECHMIIDVQEGNPGWWLKSNNDLKAKNKKALAILAFTTANGRAPEEAERKAWEKENKDDIEKVKVAAPRCPRCPDSQLSADWQGLTILLDPSRSEVARTLGIEAPGNYALKVRHQ
ncbi:MAG: transcription elongation factor subunit Spt4 [Candidatus Thermoplasmatota archaeon]|nr:transcription elongation factor subunit Spt4 [Candidatus Thermoplasmatota archaeon]